jgi:hypothetical protein
MKEFAPATTAATTTQVNNAVSGLKGTATPALDTLGKVEAVVNAIKATLGVDVPDVDNIVNKYLEMITILQNFPEGESLITKLNDAVTESELFTGGKIKPDLLPENLADEPQEVIITYNEAHFVDDPDLGLSINPEALNSSEVIIPYNEAHFVNDPEDGLSIHPDILSGLGDGAPATETIKVVRLPTDQTNNNATPNTLQDVTGLQFPVVAGRGYNFEFYIVFKTEENTTGSKWCINGPSASDIVYDTEIQINGNAKSLDLNNPGYNLGNGSSNSSTYLINIATIRGSLIANASGNVTARFSSKVSGRPVIAKAKVSFVKYIETI